MTHALTGNDTQTRGINRTVRTHLTPDKIRGLAFALEPWCGDYHATENLIAKHLNNLIADIAENT